MRREVESDLEVLRELTGVAEIREELEDLCVDLARQLERVRGAAVVTLVGATGAGKSALLNALVGRPIAREGDSRPTTRAPVIYRPLDADLSRLLADLPGETPVVVDYEPDLGGPWREQILIDAPDINSVAEEHREVVRRLAARSDVLVVVAHRQSIAELSSVAFVDAFAGRRGMIFVLNRADELTEEARDELEAQVRELARDRWRAPDAAVIVTSAHAAKTQPAAAGWKELTERLYSLVHEEVLGRVRRHNAIGTAARLARLVEERRPGIETDLDLLEQAVGAGLERWNERIRDEAAERLALRRPHVRELLWSEAARRWDGPGGWALRVGGLASLGIGAGALLARRNPLLAAGAAVGSIAVDRARGAIRQHQLTDASALLPGAGELETWYREELADARLVATRVAGSPTALGVPDGQSLADEALAALGEAWGRG
jgi:GTP-binding protein EngB required for normal cell division